MKQNLVKQKIRRGEPTIGTWLSLASVIAAEQMAIAGFDWLTIDLEHAPTNWETAMAMVAVVGAQGVAPCVRVPSSSDENIKRALDLGAMGIVAPMVTSPEQARGRRARHASTRRTASAASPAAETPPPGGRTRRPTSSAPTTRSSSASRSRRCSRSRKPRRSWPCRASTARSSGRRT